METSGRHREASEFPAPGWYRDAIDPTSERYWDGKDWQMAAPDADEMAEIEEVEPERPLTDREKRAISTDPSNLFGETAPPTERADIIRLVAWIAVGVLMFALLFLGLGGVIFSGLIGVGACAAALYQRNKMNQPVGYVPIMGLVGILLVVIGLILLLVSLALTPQLASPDTIFSDVPGKLGE